MYVSFFYIFINKIFQKAVHRNDLSHNTDSSDLKK